MHNPLWNLMLMLCIEKGNKKKNSNKIRFLHENFNAHWERNENRWSNFPAINLRLFLIILGALFELLLLPNFLALVIDLAVAVWKTLTKKRVLWISSYFSFLWHRWRWKLDVIKENCRDNDCFVVFLLQRGEIMCVTFYGDFKHQSFAINPQHKLTYFSAYQCPSNSIYLISLFYILMHTLHSN